MPSVSGEADFDGHETLWAVAGDITAGEARADVVAEYFPAFEVPAEFSGQMCSLSARKRRRRLIRPGLGSVEERYHRWYRSEHFGEAPSTADDCYSGYRD